MTTILLVIAIALAVVSVTMSIKACYVLGTNEKHYSKMFDLMNKSIDNLEEQAKESMNVIGRINKDVCDIQDVFGDTDNISNTIQLAANEAVSDAMDEIDRNLDNNVRAINTIWQSVGTLKKRMDKLDPIKRDPIDPVENLQKQTELMDTMLKEKFTDENCATMLVTTSDGITIAEFKNYYVHGGILIDDDESFYSVNMQRKGIAEMYTVVKQQVEDLEENLTQSQADVAYLTIMTDLDESEETNDE